MIKNQKQSQKTLYVNMDNSLKREVKINLNGWARNTHEASIKFLKLKKDDFVLEIGCGRGFHFPYYLEHTKNVYGIDISENVIKENMYKDEVKLSIQDIERKTNFRNEFFDVVIMVDVIEHLTNRYIPLREIKRILRDGGRLLIITPNLIKIKNRIKFLFGKYPHTASKIVNKDLDLFDGGHLQYFTYKTLKEAGIREGFKIKEEYGFGRYGRLQNFLKSLLSGSICIIFEK